MKHDRTLSVALQVVQTKWSRPSPSRLPFQSTFQYRKTFFPCR